LSGDWRVCFPKIFDEPEFLFSSGRPVCLGRPAAGREICSAPNHFFGIFFRLSGLSSLNSPNSENAGQGKLTLGRYQYIVCD
jgi:hypothetical protein